MAYSVFNFFIALLYCVYIDWLLNHKIYYRLEGEVDRLEADQSPQVYASQIEALEKSLAQVIIMKSILFMHRLPYN